ncbi:MAG: ribbon-helix-helix domain-containing protein [Alphaproteobacteria bacterium]|nr:ribbon-helix-helix domain-containing protein [Alphaproteobacteria bacterium]
MLSCRNVNVSGRRTSIRIEEELWAAADDICQREGMTLHELCTLIDQHRGMSGLTASLRVFLVVYYRLAATAPARSELGRDAGDGRIRAADRWRPFIAEMFAAN